MATGRSRLNRWEGALYVQHLTDYDAARDRLVPSTGFGYDAAGH